ncbi:MULTISPECIES: YgjV family protein [Salegentibacter]|uniref:YgjV family protein n=1 Tax=Salegentibacter maritimus TaxID=2794347 RepID=A0ABS0TJ67_9FLAO|nr:MULTISPECIES: YgjV family protein [Salegentibacter]MBE7641553.1 uroporphyrinogen decarboxylase [Salegentibacter sp. BLCTC]MBI6116852.1 YgjV family protein [Salegentibacter maritimus]MBI6121073.1 YgjV family protein [Salegentibacter maritimus]
MEFLGISLTEWIGYLSSFFIAISFFMKNIIKLRIINTLGCILFVIYGILIKSWPVIIANGIIVFVNFYYLVIDRRPERLKEDEVKP